MSDESKRLRQLEEAQDLRAHINRCLQEVAGFRYTDAEVEWRRDAIFAILIIARGDVCALIQSAEKLEARAGNVED